MLAKKREGYEPLSIRDPEGAHGHILKRGDFNSKKEREFRRQSTTKSRLKKRGRDRLKKGALKKQHKGEIFLAGEAGVPSEISPTFRRALEKKGKS